MSQLNTINNKTIDSVNNVISNKVGNTHFTQCTLNISRPEKLNYDELLKKIEAFDAEQGWLAYQSTNVAFKNKDDCIKTLKSGGGGFSHDYGKLLSAELSNQTQSISIRHLHGEQWQVTTFTEDEKGKTYLCDTVAHYATGDLGQLNYQRLWQPTKQGFEPYASYFTGFSKDGSDVKEKENNHAN